MKVIKAKSAGFCWGVERAIDIARKYAEAGRRPVYTDGPLIHNRQMMSKLENEGIREVDGTRKESFKEPESSQAGENTGPSEKNTDPVLVVRAHGISPERRKQLKGMGMEFRDATCPDVARIAGTIRKHAKQGYESIIFGDPKHPEVIGLMGYTEGRGHPVSNREDIEALPHLGDKVLFVSQSTMFTHEFREHAAYLKTVYPNLVVVDTICGATKERQGDIDKLVEGGSQAIVVIGGRHSANTVKLARLARQQNLPTYHIETPRELKPEEMAQYETVGVTAGASTPDFLIEEVCSWLEEIEPLKVT